MEELKCPICGEPTSIYMGNTRKDRLCRKHAKELKDGLIILCENCGKWHKANETCKCKQIKEIPEDHKISCIICGQPSNGKHFCYNCWKKYKDKSIDIRITNCDTTQILDEYGTKRKKAKDGRFVRSLSEKIIIDYFFDNFIRVVYEKAIPYINEKGEEKELHPDFYLTDYDLYIEFNGLTDKAYLKKKEYANTIYKQKGLKLEILENDDTDDIEKTMQKLLEKYEKRNK